MQELQRRIMLDVEADLLLGPYGMISGYHELGARWFVKRLLRPDWRYLRAWARARKREWQCIWHGHDWKVNRRIGVRPAWLIECEHCSERAAQLNDDEYTFRPLTDAHGTIRGVRMTRTGTDDTWSWGA